VAASRTLPPGGRAVVQWGLPRRAGASNFIREDALIYETAAANRPERAVLAGLAGRRAPDEVNASLDELERLADTARLQVKGRMLQRRGAPRASTYLSTGKVEELSALAKEQDADVAVFDDDLTPAQVRTLEKQLNVKVVDRSELILDIFAARARTRESRLQVELAQLEYSLPRLRHMWQHLSRTGGGIGTRGPGETQLEVDRRRARERIARLKGALEEVERERETQRKQRRRLFRVALVGYTNAGKSTLLRALTNTDVHVEDRMFATLDPTSRRLRFPREREVIVTDTVGFIRDLPKDLVAAFRATLEELSDADLLLHVVDAGSEDPDRRIEAVREVLADIGLADTPELLVFNQIDRLPQGVGQAIAARHGGVAVSALEKRGLSELIERAQALLLATPAEPARAAGAAGSGGGS